MRLIDSIARRLGYERANRGAQADVLAYEEDYGRTAPPTESVLNAQAVHATVYSAATRVAAYAASIPFSVRREVADGKDEILDHDVALLLQNPNPYQDGKQFVEQVMVYLIATGNAYLPFESDAGMLELWNVSPARVKVIPDRTDYLRGYLYEENGVKITYAVDELIHVKLGTDPRPGFHYYGLGPLQAARLELAADYDALTHQRTTLEGGGVPRGMIFPREEGVFWTAEQKETVERAWYKKHGGPNARPVAVSNGAIDFKIISQTLGEMEFGKLRAWTREQIAALIGCPPVLMGFLDGATYANSEQQMRAFVDLLDYWYLSAVASALTVFFRRNRMLNPNESLEFDTSMVRAEIMPTELRSKAAGDALMLGVLSRDEARERYFNAPPGPQPDFFIVPAGGKRIDYDTGESIDAQPAPVVDAPMLPENPEDRLDAVIGMMEREVSRDVALPAFKRRQVEWEARLLDIAQAHFAESAEIAIDNLRAHWPTPHIDMIYPLVDAQSRVEDHFGDTVIDGFLSFAGISSDRVDRLDFPPSISDDPELMATIEKMLESLHKIEDTTAHEIAAIIRAEYESGTSTLERVIEMIQLAAIDWTDERSRMVAETVMTTLSNAGEDTRIRRDDSVTMKTWRTMEDSLVRDRHADIEGETVGKDERFSNGMRYPGDPEGAPEDVIRCRCYMDAT